MRVLPIHPVSEYNTGDLMTYYGSMYLMNQAFKDVEFLHMDMHRSYEEFNTYVPEYNWGRVDAVLVCGSPFLSVNIDDHKIHLLMQAKKRFTEAKFIALGVGSNYRGLNVYNNNYYDYSNKYADNNDTSIENTRQIFDGFNLVVARDAYTYNLLEKSGISNIYHYYDTAGFSPFIMSTRKFNLFESVAHFKFNDAVFVYTNPLKQDYWAHLPTNVWNKVMEWMMDKYAKKYKIITTTSGDAEYLDSINVDHRFITDLRYLARLYNQCSEVVSTRVHQAIYAKVCGCNDVSVIPFDSRYLSALNFDIKVIQPKLDIKDFPDNATDYRLKPLRDEEKLFPTKITGSLPFNRIPFDRGIYTKYYVKLLQGEIL